MRENFLHYLWQYKKFRLFNLKTTEGKVVEVFNVGQLNTDAGPDFFNAKLKVGDQLWAGNVEIHVKASDWYTHQHETDKTYNNVILHVVWEADVEVFRTDQSKLPTLELRHYCPSTILDNYLKLFSITKKWINCENDLSSIDNFTMKNWLERLFVERLERKSENIYKLLQKHKNNWEAVFFILLARSFGSKVNGEAFMSMANAVSFSVFRKLQNNAKSLEALFFGQCMLLDKTINDAYGQSLKDEYIFLKQKFRLDSLGVLPLKFFRLRPANFPTIRLSQLATLYNAHKNLFSSVIDASSLEDYYRVFRVSTSPYWEAHYTFGKPTKTSKKIISESFVHLLLINCIMPIKFSYAKSQGKHVQDELLTLIRSIRSERNSIVDRFRSIRSFENSALVSQSLIQLKTNYCNKNKCLQCAVGNALLNRN